VRGMMELGSERRLGEKDGYRDTTATKINY